MALHMLESATTCRPNGCSLEPDESRRPNHTAIELSGTSPKTAQASAPLQLTTQAADVAPDPSWARKYSSVLRSINGSWHRVEIVAAQGQLRCPLVDRYRTGSTLTMLRCSPGPQLIFSSSGAVCTRTIWPSASAVPAVL